MSRSHRRPYRTFRLLPAGSMPDGYSPAIQAGLDAFASSAGHLDPILVVTREGGAIAQFVVMRDDARLEQARKSLAEAMYARLEELDGDVELFLDPAGARQLVVPRFGQATMRSVQAGAEPLVVTRLVASSLLVDGQWIAARFRTPRGFEIARWRQYRTSHARGETHQSEDHGAVMVSFTGGGADRSSVRGALDALASAMSGFDERTDTRAFSPSALILRGAVTAGVLAVMVALLAVVATMGVDALGDLMNEQATRTLARVEQVGLRVLIGAGLVLVLSVLTVFWMMARQVRRSALPVAYPRVRHFGFKRPRRVRDGSGSVREVPGDRPLRRNVFKLSPASFASIVAPHVGTESGAMSTKARPAPRELTVRCGTLIGLDHRGSRVHLPAASSFEGMAVVGGPGTGKTQLQGAQFASMLLDRISPSGIVGMPGTRNAIVFLDTKGDTWRLLDAWCERLGVERTVVHVADDPWLTRLGDGRLDPAALRRVSGPVIDILGSEGNADQRARFVADALKESLDDGAVQGQSLETLTKVFTGAFATTGEMVDEARQVALSQGVPFLPLGSPVTPVSIAWAYLGDPDPRTGELLYAQLSGAAQRDIAVGREYSDAVLGAQALSSLYGEGVTAARRANLTQASRNKVSMLQAAPHFWDLSDTSALVGLPRPGSDAWVVAREEELRRAREESPVRAASTSGFTSVDEPQVVPVPEVEQGAVPSFGESAPGRVLTWREILEGEKVVIVNSGVSPLSGTDMPENATQLVMSLALFSLRQAIRQVCVGWRDQGRRVTIMADELSMIAEDNVDTVEWLRDKGRGFGVELSFATQRQAQLPEKVRSSFMGFGTLIALGQDNVTIAREIAENLAGDGSPWEGQDVVNLERFHAIVRTRTSSRLPAFTVKLADFESRPELFADYQSGVVKLPGERA